MVGQDFRLVHRDVFLRSFVDVLGILFLGELSDLVDMELRQLMLRIDVPHTAIVAIALERFSCSLHLNPLNIFAE